jgi:hypothetical protein
MGWIFATFPSSSLTWMTISSPAGCWKNIESIYQYFALLEENSLKINPAKCVFAASELDFLRHLVDSPSIRTLDRHMDTIQSFLQLSIAKQLQWFLGLINFYQQFLPGISDVLCPLTNALKGGVADKGNGGQPACPGKWKRCKKKIMNSNASVIYVCVPCIV